MQRQRVTVPEECCLRPIEYLEGGPGYGGLKRMVNLNRHLWNISSRLIRPYHFEDAADFLKHQSELYVGAVLVLPELEVRDVNTGKKQEGRLDLLLGDSTGNILAIYEWKQRIENDPGAGDLDMAFDPFNNPLHGARVGDKLKIYSALYERQATVRVEDHFRVLNDDAYQRTVKRRADVMAKMDQEDLEKRVR